MKKFFFLIVGVFIFSACTLNDNWPAYIKDVVAYKEGDGIFIYFVLADSAGAMTTASGEAKVQLFN